MNWESQAEGQKSGGLGCSAGCSLHPQGGFLRQNTEIGKFKKCDFTEEKRCFQQFEKSP